MRSIVIIVVLFFASCSNENKEPINKAENEQEKILGERVDGPANLRETPNGDVIAIINDNALISWSSKHKNGWYDVVLYADIPFEKKDGELLPKGFTLTSGTDTLGVLAKEIELYASRTNDDAWVRIDGKMFQSNLKAESVIETHFVECLDSNSRDLSAWSGFIQSFGFEFDAINHPLYDTYFTYENSVDDPSPGFRMILIFQENTLIGFVHSRNMKLDKVSTDTLWNGLKSSFFIDFPKNKKDDFNHFMEEWLQGVD